MYKIKVILIATKNSFKKLFRKIAIRTNKIKQIQTKKLVTKKLILGALAVILVVVMYVLIYQKTHLDFNDKVQNKLPTQLICYYKKDIYEFTFDQGKISKLLINEKQSKFKSYNEYLKDYTTNNESMINLVNILTYRGYTCF